MKKSIINFENISNKIQEKIDKDAPNIKPEEYMYFCAMESTVIMEFYKKIEEHPEYNLFELEGMKQGIEHKGKIYLFKDYIPERYQVLIWNMLALDDEQELDKDNNLTR